MRDATSLQDLLTIRQYHLGWLRSLRGYLGSAVGFKYHERSGRFAQRKGAGVPAILVFIEKKNPDRTAIPPGEFVEPALEIPGLLRCATDVVEGSISDDEPIASPVNGANAKLRRELYGDDFGAIGGMPLLSPNGTGTAACVVTLANGARGLLTNWHVAGFEGTRLLRPEPRFQRVGYTRRSVLSPASPGSDNGSSTTVPRHPQRHRLDVAFVELMPALAVRAKPGVHGLDPLGKRIAFDPETMGPIGQKVMGVGQALGLRRGMIAAYAYEWRLDPNKDAWETTDFLIVGRTPREPFAAAGDSGMLVVTDDERRSPIALVWGGQRHGFWSACAQQSWAYASDINAVLDELDAEIFTGRAQPAAKPEKRARLHSSSRA